jgi:lysophospholipase L1-like esterase
MQRPSRRFILLGVCSIAILGGMACGQPAGGMFRTGRTPAEREKLVQPGQFGENGAANVRRFHFDFWNEQIVREDQPVSTVFMGDSITELWDLHAYFKSSPGEVIENRGIGGDLASIMARRFEADVLQLRPHNVVILAGTNDVNYLPSKGKNPDEIFTETVAALESMIDQAQKAGVNVLMCSILPTNAKFGMHAVNPGLRARINQRVQALCREKKCIYVDYAAALQDAQGALREDLARDGLHPHWAGYEIMARVLKAAAKANGVRL